MIVLGREGSIAEVAPMTGWPEPVTTDDQGRFTIHGVNTDRGAFVEVADERFARWHFYIGRPGAGMTAAEVRKKYPYVFVGEEFVAQKDPAEEVTLVPPASQIIEGRVVYDDSKKPVPFARLNVDAGALEAGSWATTYGQADAEGQFRINPHPGNYFHVKAYPPSGQPYLIAENRWLVQGGFQAEDRDCPAARSCHSGPGGRSLRILRGKPVSGASIQYETKHAAEGIVTGWQGVVLSGPTGSFRSRCRQGAACWSFMARPKTTFTRAAEHGLSRRGGRGITFTALFARPASGCRTARTDDFHSARRDHRGATGGSRRSPGCRGHDALTAMRQ